MKRALLHLLYRLDHGVARLGLALGSEQPALVILLVHALFRDRAEREKELIFPHEWLTVAQFREMVLYFLEKDYAFIRPKEIADLNPRKKYVLLSFDDGYANNVRALPTLREFGIPAVFSISSEYVQRPRRFWWDAHYQFGRAAGKSFQTLLREQQALKQLSWQDVERKLGSGLGHGAFKSRHEVERPFSLDELKDFAREPGVILGNHTRHHAILTEYSADTIVAEIQGCQEDLENWTGQRPEFIAYPNGNVSTHIAQIAQSVGLRWGVQVIGPKQRFPLPAERMYLPRQQVYGIRSIRRQGAQIRAGWSIKKVFAF